MTNSKRLFQLQNEITDLRLELQELKRIRKQSVEVKLDIEKRISKIEERLIHE